MSSLCNDDDLLSIFNIDTTATTPEFCDATSDCNDSCYNWNSSCCVTNNQIASSVTHDMQNINHDDCSHEVQQMHHER